MNNQPIGVSLHVGTLLDEPESDAQAILCKEYGGARALLRALERAGVRDIEIRNVREKMPVERTLAAVRAVRDAGFSMSLHIAFEKSQGEAYLRRVSAFLQEALGAQETLTFTLHPVGSETETREKYADWARAFAECDGRYRLALENMRVMKPGAEFNRIASVYGAVRAANAPSAGICWDMGHYAYNVVTGGLPARTPPEEDILRRVIHTHIHSLYMPSLDTHHPVTEEDDPARAYVAALQSADYRGIYNLELEPERFFSRVSPREGFDRSIAVLKGWLA